MHNPSHLPASVEDKKENKKKICRAIGEGRVGTLAKEKGRGVCPDAVSLFNCLYVSQVSLIHLYASYEYNMFFARSHSCPRFISIAL